MSLAVTHKYPWKFQQIAIIALFALIPFVMYGLTFVNITNMISTIIFGAISLGLAVWLFSLNYKRLKKSTLHATVDDEGIVTIWGAGLDAKYNKGNPEELVSISLDERAYHPTLNFNYEDGRSLTVPRRIALIPEFNYYLRHHMPKQLTVTTNARETFEYLFVPAEKRRALPVEETKVTETTSTNSVEETPKVSVEDNNVLNKEDAKRRKEAAREEKRLKAERIAASIAAVEAEEAKMAANSKQANRL